MENSEHRQKLSLGNRVRFAVRQFNGLFNRQPRKSGGESSSSSQNANGRAVGAPALMVAQTPQANQQVDLSRGDTLDEDEEARKQLLLRQLPDHQVFRNFVEIMQIPRQTFKEFQIRKWLMDAGKELGCDVKIDAVGNLRIRRPASPGFENRPKIAIQAHMDMVCEKAPGKLINFDLDPIKGFVKDGWLMAEKTTLGADNGIGVAAALAILQEPFLRSGQIEILLTMAEEKDMRGAANIDPTLLDSDILINVDSESEHEICAGSAGGFGKILTGKPQRASRQRDEVPLEISIGNLAGGHTGVNIHEGHANAVVVWARLMDTLIHSGIKVRVVSLSGGSAHNAIPRQVDCTIYIPKDQEIAAKKIVQESFNEINKEYSDFESRKWVLGMEGAKPDSFRQALTIESTQDLVDIILQIPDGIDRMNAGDMAGVESSMTLSIAKMNPVNGNFQLEMFARSSSPSRLRFLDQRLNAIARSRNVKASQRLRPFPGWSPKADSVVLNKALQTHLRLFNEKPKIFSIHAGLECGVLAKTYPKLDTISIGPTILGAHTTDERLKVSSVIPFYDW
eukprot:CAMPEP_0184490270 /NCGR_PEP_ID=MMETSP0113_2-20130426/17445_1 /TAXON_ID=91329 /ORGANISM="Norrisiella sphaerica, Strain BC52" /LENGTH=564 /DNA_ID=CAMNT_0026874065 /DNA_START=126 /DNA_END=1817 /DNA_ORIENTATION=+